MVCLVYISVRLTECKFTLNGRLLKSGVGRSSATVPSECKFWLAFWNSVLTELFSRCSQTKSTSDEYSTIWYICPLGRATNTIDHLTGSDVSLGDTSNSCCTWHISGRYVTALYQIISLVRYNVWKVVPMFLPWPMRISSSENKAAYF